MGVWLRFSLVVVAVAGAVQVLIVLDTFCTSVSLHAMTTNRKEHSMEMMLHTCTVVLLDTFCTAVSIHAMTTNRNEHSMEMMLHTCTVVATINDTWR